MEAIRDNRKRTVWNERLLLAMFVTYLVMILLVGSQFVTFYFYGHSWKNSDLSKALFKANAVVGIFYTFGVYIPWMIVFLVWMYRAYSNLHRLNEPKLYHKLWVIFAWFIPIVNLILPYRMLKQLFSVSVRLGGDYDLSLSKRIVWQLNACWSLWIVFWMFSISSRIIDSWGHSRSTTQFLGITSSVMMLLALVFILSKYRMIRTYKMMENRIYRRLVGSDDQLKSDNLIDSI
ncbi:MAG: DUF4328 domain-containing protein [Flavobacteriia bacterium]|nr:DUF4328 domain-containing protein [Flavobacteriia bacterium]